MIVVAFHYRLPGDPLGQPEGAWREFDGMIKAGGWLFQRSNKTATSPKGCNVYCFKALTDIPKYADQWEGWLDMPPSLMKAIVSYCKYKNHERPNDLFNAL